MSRPALNRPDAVRAIFRGGLVAGTLDAVDAVIAFGILGMSPVQVLQYVASGVQGSAAFVGNALSGFANAALGAVLHYFIAFVAAAVYYAAALKIPSLVRRPIAYGQLYGAWVYLFMNYLISPFSAVAKSPFSWGLFLNGIIGHGLFVGLPIALFTARSGRRATTDSSAEHRAAA